MSVRKLAVALVLKVCMLWPQTCTACCTFLTYLHPGGSQRSVRSHDWGWPAYFSRSSSSSSGWPDCVLPSSLIWHVAHPPTHSHIGARLFGGSPGNALNPRHAAPRAAGLTYKQQQQLLSCNLDRKVNSCDSCLASCVCSVCKCSPLCTEWTLV